MSRTSKRNSIESKISRFIESNEGLLGEYYESVGCDISANTQDIAETLQDICCDFPGIDCDDVLINALHLSIKTNDTFGDTLKNITDDLKKSPPQNGTQAYFNEIGRIYKNKKGSSLEFREENRDNIISLNTKLVISIAKRYTGLGLDIEDLISAGNVGLCIAWNKFDPSRANLKNEILDRLAGAPQVLTDADCMQIMGGAIQYGKLKSKFDQYFVKGQTYKKDDVLVWVQKNIYNAKFSSVAAMWIRAYILIELDNNSRLVKKPRTTIYKDRSDTGGYKVDRVVSIDSPMPSDSVRESSLSDMLSNSDEELTDEEKIEYCDTYKQGLIKLLKGIPIRDRAVLLKKYGIGLPRPLTPKEISQQEGVSLARISQICQSVIDKMRKNAKKYNIDPQVLFETTKIFE